MLDKPAPAQVFDADLSAIRALANVVPGPLPVALNAVKFAASIRPRKFVVEGGDETPVTMPRTACQVVYPDGNVMIDAGMDKPTHDSFGEGEPYDSEAFAQLIARELGGSFRTVEIHRAQVMRKMAARHLPELVRMSIESLTPLRGGTPVPHRAAAGTHGAGRLPRSHTLRFDRARRCRLLSAGQ